jgi:hypothetical protein
LSAENAEQYLHRLKDRDARFTYEITFGNDRGPETGMRQPGLLVSVTDQQKTINVFARDVQALELSPAKATFTLQGPGVERMHEFLRTGKPQETAPGELTSFSSDLDFLLPRSAEPVTTWRLMMNPSKDQLPRFSFRVTFGEGADAVVYELVHFQTVRRGTEEAELRSTTRLPFEIQILVEFAGRGSVSFRPQLAGFPVQQVHRATKAIRAVTGASTFELYDLTAGQRFLKLHTGSDCPVWMQSLERFAAEATTVSEFYGAKLTWPSETTKADVETIHRLRELIDGVPIPVKDISARLTKLAQLPDAEIQDLLKKPVFRFEHAVSGLVQPFGAAIVPGSIEILVDQCRVMNKDDFSQFLLDAPLGTDFTLEIQTCGLALAKALSRAEPVPGSSN